jgi:hypothetical protein
MAPSSRHTTESTVVIEADKPDGAFHLWSDQE